MDCSAKDLCLCSLAILRSCLDNFCIIYVLKKLPNEAEEAAGRDGDAKRCQLAKMGLERIQSFVELGKK